MVREETLTDSKRYVKNGIVASTPKYEKRHRGKSADRVHQRSLVAAAALASSAGGLHRVKFPGSQQNLGTPRIQAKIMHRRQSVFSSSNGGLSAKPSAQSFSSLSSEASKTSKMGSSSTPTAASPPTNDAGLYEKLLWSHQHDPKSKEDLVLNRRVGFYRFKSDIGAGNFSKVKLAQHQLTKERVAVKIIDKGKLDGKTQKMVTREINIMDSLSHPNLIRLFEVTETLSGIYLMMEYAPGGELFVRLAEVGRYSEQEARPIFAQIASAVEYMHERNFIHRDLKAENVFFAKNYPTGTKSKHSNHHKNGFLSASLGNNKKMEDLTDIQVKVGDFGFATQVDKIDQHLTTFCGSPPYAAPELFQDDHYLGPSVDIWALGILLYLMVTGSMPFKGTTVAELKHSILDGHFEMPEYLSANCIDLVSGILKRRPDWRLTLKQVRESKWLWRVEWPQPDTNFRPLPKRLEMEASLEQADLEEPLSPVEEKTRQILASEIGINQSLLESHIDKGPRSHIIGAFRILQKRIINAEKSREASEEAEVKDLGSLSQAATTSTPIKPKTWLQKSWNGLRKSPTPPPPPPTELDFSKHQKDNNKQLLTVKNKSKKSSKMCLIL